MDTKCRCCGKYAGSGKDLLCIPCRRGDCVLWEMIPAVRYTYEVKYWTPEQAEAMAVWPPREG